MQQELTEMRTAIRTFETGATRNPLGDKIQWIGPQGLLSIPALREFGSYMRRHRRQEDGSLRDYNNWRLNGGIPQAVSVDSLGRHVLDVADLSEGRTVLDENGNTVTMIDACCAVIFNAFSILNGELSHGENR
jgi:hypothetical protein